MRAALNECRSHLFSMNARATDSCGGSRQIGPTGWNRTMACVAQLATHRQTMPHRRQLQRLLRLLPRRLGEATNRETLLEPRRRNRRFAHRFERRASALFAATGVRMRSRLRFSFTRREFIPSRPCKALHRSHLSCSNALRALRKTSMQRGIQSRLLVGRRFKVPQPPNSHSRTRMGTKLIGEDAEHE